MVPSIMQRRPLTVHDAPDRRTAKRPDTRLTFAQERELQAALVVIGDLLEPLSVEDVDSADVRQVDERVVDRHPVVVARALDDPVLSPVVLLAYE